MPAEAERRTAALLGNGLRVAVERIPGVQSVAFHIILPDGSAFDPPGRCGEAALLSEIMQRGAGKRDARAFSEAADEIGFDRSIGYSNESITISGAVLSGNLEKALDLTRDLWFEPMIAEAEMGPARDLCIQDILAIEDSPNEKLFDELRMRAMTAPYNRPSKGSVEEIAAITRDHLRLRVRALGTRDAILCLAGNVEPEEGIRLIESRFGNAFGVGSYPTPPAGPLKTGSSHMEKSELAQVQIGVAYQALTPRDPDYPVLRLIVSALSGGMSGRLFVEVREKRGLVYAVKSWYSALRATGRIYVYAGTTPQRAARTVEVLESEFERLANGLDADELEKARIQTKSAVVMGMESPRARAATMSSDYFYLGEVRSPEEIIASYDAVGLDRMRGFLANNPFRERYLLTLGPLPESTGGAS